MDLLEIHEETNLLGVEEEEENRRKRCFASFCDLLDLDSTDDTSRPQKKRKTILKSSKMMPFFGKSFPIISQNY